MVVLIKGILEIYDNVIGILSKLATVKISIY